MAEKTNKYRVLCVDDEQKNLELLDAILSPLGYEMILVENGPAALEALKGMRLTPSWTTAQTAATAVEGAAAALSTLVVGVPARLRRLIACSPPVAKTYVRLTEKVPAAA